MFVILSERGEKETGTKIQQLFLGNRQPQDVPKGGKKKESCNRETGWQKYCN
jgi:hypothetical protein